MGIIWSRCCCKSKKADYKKLDVQPNGSSSADIEAGGMEDDDDEEWDQFPPAAGSGGACGGVEAEAMEEPEPDEPDPFAEMGMAPKIKPTKRHAAQSVWAQPAAPTNSRFAMAAEDTSAADAGWGGEDDLADLGVGERRRVAEQRREQRRRQREEGGLGAREKPRGLKAAATKVNQ